MLMALQILFAQQQNLEKFDKEKISMTRLLNTRIEDFA